MALIVYTLTLRASAGRFGARASASPSKARRRAPPAPFIRRGIVSSVFPFSIPKPHGFTIDIMQQGGSSGSPIFYDNEPTVVGMMASGIRDIVSAESSDAMLTVATNTNISIALSSHMIKLALPTFVESPCHVDPSQFTTLDEWKASHVPKQNLGWDQFQA
jgi:hypothetical protein